MRRSFFFLLPAILLLAGSCRQESDLFDGPSLNDIYGEFSFIQPFLITDESVDFGEPAFIVVTPNNASL